MAGAMPKRPSTKIYEWRITRIRSTPAALIGHVEAPDAEQAIRDAIRQFGITDPEQQKRLAAQPVKEIKRALTLRSLFVLFGAWIRISGSCRSKPAAMS
jgi:hypothetical protein